MKCKNLICTKRAIPNSPYCSYDCAPGTKLNPPVQKIYNFGGYRRGDKKQEKQMQEKEQQDLAYESMKFVLAGCMIDLHMFMSLKDQAGMRAIVGKVTRMLQLNPDFVNRFREEQKVMYAKLQAREKPSGQSSSIV
jgi:translation initiation factor IF-3